MSTTSPPSSPASDKEGRVGSHVVCTAPGCNQSFSNASELAVHKQKHQMTLKLGPSRTGLADMLPFDQTPTPTKFLQYGKETGLFDEISNPFDCEFKRGTSQGQSLKEKARRSALPQLVINSQMKARTPTSYPSSNQLGFAPVAQPVHVITLTPTLPSPVGAIPGTQFFLPSPQGFISSPLAGPSSIPVISPSIVPFSAGLPFPTMQQVVEAQQAAIAQAFLNAANAPNHVSQATNHLHQSSDITTTGHHLVASRTSSANQTRMTTVPFPTQTVSVPVHNNPTPPTGLAISAGQSMPSAPVGSASVIQQHGQGGMDQRRPLTQSNSLDHANHQAISSTLQRKSSFPGETSVITQAPPNSSAATQMNTNMNMHPANSVGYQYMDPQALPPFPQSSSESSRMANHPVLTATRSMPAQNNMNMQIIPTLPHQNSLPNIDAKQKLKETLTNNNPNLQVNIPNFNMHDMDDDDDDDDDDMNRQNEVTSSSGDTKMPGRRRGRQSDLDPDQKRMRFLERNRAAASRCRAKKKQWVSGLEVKAKELNNSNISLQNEVASLREEVASLKQLLLAHRDCPITRVQQQKLGIVGKDPTSVVSNPVQAAASLLAFSMENQTDPTNNTVITSAITDEVKPNPVPVHMTLTHTTSNGSMGGDPQGGGSNAMQPSVLVSTQVIGKAEPPSNFPTPIGQMPDGSSIGINSNNNGYLSSSSLSTASST